MDPSRPSPHDPAGSGVERLLYASPSVRVGRFACRADDPGFRTAGPIEGYTVFFPRTAVWIEHAGCPPFVADPGVVTIYNEGQPYVRHPLAPDGDRGEWFSVSRDRAIAIARSIDPDADPARPFQPAMVACDARLYRRQRRFVVQLAAGVLDERTVEREVVALIREVLTGARRSNAAAAGAERARRDLVERARAELARDPTRAIGLRDLADRVGASPFHLCRLFRRVTGVTLGDYRLDLRARLALERLEASDRGLSAIAHGLGFSSHSHFTFAFRTRMGGTPSSVGREFERAAGRPGRAMS